MSDNTKDKKSKSGSEQPRQQSDFFEKKGFYIVLTICVVLVAITAIYVGIEGFGAGKPGEIDLGEENRLSSSLSAEADNTDGDNADEVSLSRDKTIQDAIGDSADIGTVNDTDSANKAGENHADNAEYTSNSTVSDKPGEPDKADGENSASEENGSAGTVETAASNSFDMPVIGQITQEYAMDHLIYSKTLAQWQTHSGIDIGASLGTAVKAAADGVVREIKDDAKFGATVIMEHEGGYKTIYSNLASGEAVLPNQILKRGDVIGAVGDTAAHEKVEATHLHFEVWKDDTCIDPAQVLSALKVKAQ